MFDLCSRNSLREQAHTRLEVREAVVGISEGRLGGDGTKCKHGKATIGNLAHLHPVLLLLALVLEEGKGVKAKVTSLAITLSLRHLNEDSTGAELDEANSEEKESHRSLVHENIVGLIGSGNTLHGVDLPRETEGEAEATIGGDPTEPGEHSNAAVLQLGLAHEVKSRDSFGLLPLRRLKEAREVLGDRGEVEGVETNIANVRPIQVDRTREPRERRRPLGFVHHSIPQTIRHGVEGHSSLVRRIGRERGGRAGKESSDGELHG
mmetsp:Transcript_8465/g.25574  ORF Transcript_8465/g.25574 Transcript_8465/m.25574 type:complete len:264 (+) Transcript_8465:285-1076(+)